MGIIELIKSTIYHFNNNNSTQMAAALSYYSLFAIAPVLLILVNVLGIFLSDAQTQQVILTKIYDIFPLEIAEVIRNVVINISEYTPPNTIVGFISIAILVVSSTTIVRELQKMLNIMWEIDPSNNTVTQRIRKRYIAFFFLIILGMLLLTSFVLNALIGFIGYYITSYIGLNSPTLYIANTLLSLCTVSILFALLFRYLPDATLAWKDIILGSLLTGMLFMVGKTLMSYVLSYISFGSLYGTTGTILLFLIWVYYSSLIFLFGSSFTYIYAQQQGSGVPIKN